MKHGATTKTVSLADARMITARLSTTSRSRQRAQSSAVRSIARWTGLPPDRLPAHPDQLRPIFDAVAKSGAAVRPHTLANVKLACLDMIADSGLVDGLRHRARRKPLSPIWEAFYQELDTRRLRVCLTRIIRYSSNAAVVPTEFNDEVFSRYCDYVSQTSLQANLHRLFRQTAIAWNDARPLFPDLKLAMLTVPPSKRVRTLVALDDLAPTMQAQIADFQEWATGTDIFAANARKRPLTPGTCGKIIQDIRRAITLLANAGAPLDSITSLSVVLTRENFTTLLRAAHREKGGKPSSYNFGMALSLSVIGRDYLQLDPAIVAELMDLAYTIPRPPLKITVKNTKLIGRFDDAETILRLRDAPRDLWKIVRSHKTPNRWTLAKAQAAIAIAMLTVIPLRLGNLSALTFDEHVFLRPKGVSTISIPPHENKSGTALAFDIPDNIVAMLVEYRDLIAPKIIGHRPRYLFCRDDGRPKNFATVRHNIQTYIARYLGFHMNPHAFRHLAAKITLDQDPGAHGQVQQLLGHNRITTTENFYVGWDTKRAQRGHIRSLDKAYEEAGRRKQKKSAAIKEPDDGKTA